MKRAKEREREREREMLEKMEENKIFFVYLFANEEYKRRRTVWVGGGKGEGAKEGVGQ